MRVRIIASSMLMVVLLAACGGSSADVDSDGGDDLRPEVAAAVEDLAIRHDAAATDIEVVRFESVTWSDGSLGCPEPDVLYTQALVDGYQIELALDGATYLYHGAEGEDPFLCMNEA